VKIKSLQIRAWSKLGMEKALFGVGMMEVMQQHPDTYVVTADLCGYSGMDRLARAFPDKIVNVGIQEQNMLGVAAGLALEGKMVFAGSYGAFAVARAMEQVRHNMSVLNTNIKLVGYSSGYTKGTLGYSHWATEDIAFTRCLPNMTVLSPADATEAVKACLAAAETRGPCYIRLCGGANCPPVYQEDYDFEIGRGVRLREGNHTAILATGRMVGEALKAAELLEGEGLSVGVVDMHTIKPLDEALVAELAPRYRHLFTAEEHNVIGGLGSAVAEWMSAHPGDTTLHRIGMQDQVYRIGSESFVWEQAGMRCEQIVAQIKDTVI